MEYLPQLIISAPAAASVIIAVVLFLRHLKDERKSRDNMQIKWLDTMNKLAGAVSELTVEVRLLRDIQHDQAG